MVPDPSNDRKNAEDYVKYKQNTNQTSKIHLTLSATFPNLQKPENITTILGGLEKDFPNAFNMGKFLAAPESRKSFERFIKRSIISMKDPFG